MYEILLVLYPGLYARDMRRERAGGAFFEAELALSSLEGLRLLGTLGRLVARANLRDYDTPITTIKRYIVTRVRGCRDFVTFLRRVLRGECKDALGLWM